jgi:hypothetical protein
MKKAVSVCMILSLTVIFASHACRADVSRSGVLFLRIAAGARAAGMGEAFVAISDDATATHWNPAGLGNYPLTSTWLEYPLPSQFELKSIALLRNDVPELNYKRYDVWAISDLDLFRLHRSIWLDYEEYSTQAGESLESILRKYTEVSDDERIKRMKELTARFNYGVSKDSLMALKEKVMRSGNQTGEISSLWEEFLSAWDNCLLMPDGLSILVKQLNDFLSDDSLSSEEMSQITSSLPKVILRRLLDTVKIPYSVLFTDTLTTAGSDGKLLWIGSKDGLFSFDGKRWKRYAEEDGLPSAHVTAILPLSERYVWVGTDQGTAKFDGSTWTKVPFGDEIQDMQVVDFTHQGERQIWAATRSKIFQLDGETWLPHEKYAFKIGDTLEKVVRKFIGSEDENTVLQAMEKVKAYNALQDTAVATGQTINLPFELALNGEITTLTLDDKQNLWVGTNHGLKRYTENRWFTYGYKVYTAVEGDDTKKVAKEFLNSEDEEKIQRLSGIIIDYNRLDPSGKLNPGQKVYVYSNATGSEILSMAEVGGDKLVVGTEYGTIRWDGESWGRYYHAGLEQAKTKKIIHQDGELWFATTEKMVIYAHAKREITFMHANWLPELASDLYYEYLSYVQHMEGWGTLGANLTFLSLGKNVRTDEYGAIKGEFDSYEMAFAFSYGTRLSPNLSTGLSAKIIYSHLADRGAGYEKGKGSGSSFALDAGLIYNNFILKKLTWGTALTNLGPNIAYIDLNQSDPLPRNLAVGLAYRMVDTPFNRLTATFEINKELVGVELKDDPNTPVKEGIRNELKEAIENMGIEYWYGSYVSLRAGYVYDQVGDVKNPTFGAGLQYGAFRFDFAYIPSSKTSALSNTMRFSMTGRF